MVLAVAVFYITIPRPSYADDGYSRANYEYIFQYVGECESKYGLCLTGKDVTAKDLNGREYQTFYFRLDTRLDVRVNAFWKSEGGVSYMETSGQ